MGCGSSNAAKLKEIEEKREERTQGFKEMDAPVVAETNLENVKANIKLLKKHSEPVALTLSKDAFGHGAVQVARLAVSLGVDYFVVSSVKEGIELREGGITPDRARILVLAEPVEKELVGYCAFALGILITCRRSATMIRSWSKLHQGKRKLFPYVLVDAGYTGIGIPAKAVQQCVSTLVKAKNNKVNFQGLIVRTTDDKIGREHPTIDLEQIFEVASSLKEKEINIKTMLFENNPSLLRDWSKLSRDLGREFAEKTTVYSRCSVETFGFGNKDFDFPKLRQCLSLKAQVRDIRKVALGEWIGLGEGWQAVEESFVAVLACGFANGYPQFMNEKQKQALVRKNNRSYAIIGEIGLDHILVNLGSTDQASEPPVKVGDFMTLFGPPEDDRGNMGFLHLCELAEVSPTQTLCHISASVSKSWKSTGLTRRNTKLRLAPKDPKELEKEEKKKKKKAGKAKKDGKAKKGSKKKDVKKRTKKSTKGKH